MRLIRAIASASRAIAERLSAVVDVVRAMMNSSGRTISQNASCFKGRFLL
jgi:hypothetical protein